MTPVQTFSLLVFVLFAAASLGTTFWLIGLLRHVLQDTYSLQSKLRESQSALIVRAQRAEEQLSDERDLLRTAIAQASHLEVARQQIEYLQGQLHQHTLSLIDSANIAQARVMALLDRKKAAAVMASPRTGQDNFSPGRSGAPPEPIDDAGPPGTPEGRSLGRVGISTATPQQSRVYGEPAEESLIDAGLRAVMRDHLPGEDPPF